MKYIFTDLLHFVALNIVLLDSMVTTYYKIVITAMNTSSYKHNNNNTNAICFPSFLISWFCQCHILQQFENKCNMCMCV